MGYEAEFDEALMKEMKQSWAVSSATPYEGNLYENALYFGARSP